MRSDRSAHQMSAVGAARAVANPAWRDQYPAFARLLMVHTGGVGIRLARRIADLRNLAANGPRADAGRSVGATPQRLHKLGPSAPSFPLAPGAAELADTWLRTTSVAG